MRKVADEPGAVASLAAARKRKDGQAGSVAEGSHGQSPRQRAEAGKNLRDRLPRSLHAGWKRRAHRADPVDLLQAADADRMPDLVPIRYGRMLQSPFAFYRGSAGIMAADLAHTPTTGIRVQACGDCHLMNFGGFATPERNIIFDINDFDETLPAPWEWDVKRLAASFVLAARTNGLSDDKAREAAMACVRSYRKRLRDFAEMHPLDVWYARVTSDDMLDMVPPATRKMIAGAHRARRPNAGARKWTSPSSRKWSAARSRIRDMPPLIFHPEIARAPEFEAIAGAGLPRLPRDPAAMTGARCWTTTGWWTPPSRWWASAASDGAAGSRC